MASTIEVKHVFMLIYQIPHMNLTVCTDLLVTHAYKHIQAFLSCSLHICLCNMNSICVDLAINLHGINMSVTCLIKHWVFLLFIIITLKYVNKNRGLRKVSLANCLLLLQPAIWKNPFHELSKLLPSKNPFCTKNNLCQSYLDGVNPPADPLEVIQLSVYSYFS